MQHDIELIGIPDGARADLRCMASGDGVELYRLQLSLPEETVPTPLTLRWEQPMQDILCQWTPTGGRDRSLRQWFAPIVCRSDFCFGAPILCTIGSGDRNRETVAVSDGTTPITIRFYVDDFSQRDKVVYSVEFFSGCTDALTDYTADIRIDTRSVPYYEAIMSVSAWWAEYGKPVADCPPAAEDALYSSWYNFHQSPRQEALLADLLLAADAGFRTAILDDGWQFDGKPEGNYAQCGAWTVATGKFPDFSGFVRSVHALGMKLMVWFTVPFIGEDSPLCKQFEGKYLYYANGCAAYVLDPRYPDVRQWILDTYRRFLLQYDIDGFKLDFVDSFHPGDLMKPFHAGMDCAGVGEAVHRLLTEVTQGLAEVKPGLLYEYRQNYVGPAINRFGNMLRVLDCAYDALTNRIGIVDLRLLNHHVAVHSDMLFWSREESVELCARQLLNILFAVPQISVILADATEEQRRLLRYYLGYWTDNRAVLLHGTFRASRPDLNYTRVSSEDSDKRIMVLYADEPYTFDGLTVDVFHGGNEEGIVFENPTGRAVLIAIYDCMGEPILQTTLGPGDMRRLPVPPAGRLHATVEAHT